MIEQAIAFISFSLAGTATAPDGCELQAACQDAAEALGELKTALNAAAATQIAA